MASTPGSRHRRNVSSRSRPRAPTKGPLEVAEDPLGASENPGSPQRSKPQSPVNTSNASHAPSPSPLDQFDAMRAELDSIMTTQDSPPFTKDLSYLLRADMYHPLSQLDIPPAFRSSFYQPPPGEPLSSSLSTLNTLLAQGHFLLAAHLCGTLLTSPAISPTDHKTIFTLFYTRLACLELTGNTVFAAQESKALEDLSSAFYYVDADFETAEEGQSRSHRRQPIHIVPWPLRVLAVRLQSIGFGDTRRSVAGLYELGLEARREIMRPDIDDAKKQIWKARLADLGIRSVNALIEMGDMDAARRSLDTLKGKGADNDSMRMRKVLLYLRIGDVGAAKEVLQESSGLDEGILKPLINMAEGRFDDAVAEWRALLEKNSNTSSEPMIAQNLASRALLESLVSANHSFPSLTFNLSTIYELCSEKSRNLKMHLADEVAKQTHSGETNLDRSNADFKL
ncbi:hypothetical protein T310_7607 [Rasamsonia emersonii CBS 393.64]|uniref:Uncharacterized protein n=1 Tax=Rasamsonia emersonii (strain ATCC 16479 / CBS 393.64 / IMI 116815) TaxID=1408163 RepID=A0A0F4YJZ3_RASE3|nr:hypothetical protein T310_7607 [Rasamsonia emersonii CBS 393.64]KKA18440.1 hypothetical protein T310_7607 [Rasamsonia emersonii CBS 393.64]